jgi:cell division septal protein FtsQ
MHYQGTKVPLSEKSNGFRSAGIPVRRFWSRHHVFAGSHEEKKENKKLSFKIFAGVPKPKLKPAGVNYTFYRSGTEPVTAETVPQEKIERFKRFFGDEKPSNQPEFFKKERMWNVTSHIWASMKPLAWIPPVVFLIAAVWWVAPKAMSVLPGSAGLKLTKVIIEGAHYLTQADVLETANLSPGADMFKLNLEDLSQKLAKLSWIDRVFVERRLPSSILISIQERKPVALLDNGRLYGIDKNGRILSPSDALLNQDLPLVSGVRFSVEAVGTTQTAEILKPALDFFNFLAKKDAVLAHDISEVNLSEPESLKVTFINGVEVTFNTSVSDTDLKRMALVLGDLNEKRKKASTMDFRYKDMAFVKTR